LSQELNNFVVANWYGLLSLVLAAVVLSVGYRSGWLAGKRGVGREVMIHPAPIWLLCALLVWMSSLVAGSIAMGLSGMKIGTLLGSTKAQAVFMLSTYGVSLTIGGLLVYLMNASAPRAGLECKPKSLALGVGLLLLAWPVVTVASVGAAMVHQQMFGPIADSVAHPTLQLLVDNKGDVWAWLLAGLAVIAAPVQEEIIYRGFLQSALLRATKSAWWSIVVTSMIFALAHVVGVGVVPWYAAVALFVLSLTIGLAFERTGRLGVAIGMHVMFNAVNVALAVWQSRS